MGDAIPRPMSCAKGVITKNQHELTKSKLSDTQDGQMNMHWMRDKMKE